MEAYTGTYPTFMVDLKVVNYFRKTDSSSLFDGVLNTPLFYPDVGSQLAFTCSKSTMQIPEKGVNMFKVNNKNTRTT